MGQQLFHSADGVILVQPATALLLASLFISSWCSAQTTDSPAANREPQAEAAAAFQAYAREVASSYELQSRDKSARPFTRVAEPILRWSNPLGGWRAHGEIFLWTDSGIPVAVVSINEFTRANGKTDGEQEWCSLTNRPIVATGPHRWAPETGGLSFLPMPGEQAVADSPARRLRQMRELATHFSGTKTTRAGANRELRLLPQPIYRYQSKDDDIPDGGLFALVEATDPEGLLLLEARQSKSGGTWHYAFGRLNSVKLTASLDGKQVWEAPELPASEVYDRTDKPYSAFLVK